MFGIDVRLSDNREEGRRWGLGRNLGPLVPSQLASRCQKMFLLSNRPHKACQFPGHGRHSFLTTLASLGQRPKAAMQPLWLGAYAAPPRSRNPRYM